MKLKVRCKYSAREGRWYPSGQICRRCGTVHREVQVLNVRTMRCDCGLVFSRNQNAGISILNEGMILLQNGT